MFEQFKEHEVSKNAEFILSDRMYLKRDNQPVESSWHDIARRVARYVATAEVGDDVYGGEKLLNKIKEKESIYFELLNKMIFIPNSPTLFNAGEAMPIEWFRKSIDEMSLEDYKQIYNSRSKHNMLSACFVHYTEEDSMDGIFQYVKDAAIILKYGGGVGYDFSTLRPKGTVVNGTSGYSSGPVSFMKVYDSGASTIQQGGKRRAAQMAVMRYDHPDIKEFISAKRNNDGKSVLSFFNLSVNIDKPEEFYNKYINNENYDLVFNGKKYGEQSAKELLDIMAESAWKSGDPGMLFLGRHNQYYANAENTPVNATNPCGEETLPNHGSCNLGSLNLKKINEVLPQFYIYGTDDFQIFGEIVEWAITFLDDVVSVNVYPLEQISNTAKSQRFIGLGIMGFADLLFEKNIPYGSKQARSLAAEIQAALSLLSHEASSKIAQEKGNFEVFNDTKYPNGHIPFPMHEKSDDIVEVSENLKALNQAIKHHFETVGSVWKRNVQTNTIAPTGTLSNLADVSSGLEPNFALFYTRNVLTKEGESVPLLYTNSVFEKILKQEYPQIYTEIKEKIEKFNSLVNSGVSINDRKVQTLLIEIMDYNNLEKYQFSEAFVQRFQTAQKIAPIDHLYMQVAFQEYIDASVSKTINMPYETTVDDIKNIYIKALNSFVKGITVYRDGSLSTQVLQTVKKDKKDDSSKHSKVKVNLDGLSVFVDSQNKLRPKPRKETMPGIIKKVKIDGEHTTYIHVSIDMDTLSPAEIFISNGNPSAALIGRLSSLALRAGVSPDEIIKQLRKSGDNYAIELSKHLEAAFEELPAFFTNIKSQSMCNKAPKFYTQEEMEKLVYDENKHCYIDNEGSVVCEVCGGVNTIQEQEGCSMCTSCGTSKCL